MLKRIIVRDAQNIRLDSYIVAEDKEISKALNLEEDIVSSVMTKPISNLRKNKDNTAKIKQLKTKLTELKKFDPVKFTEKIINEL